MPSAIMAPHDDPRFLPFTRNDAYGTLGMRPLNALEKARLALLAVTVVPIKLLGALTALLSFWACCHLSALLPATHRIPVVAVLGRIHTRVCLLWLGFLNLRWVRAGKRPQVEGGAGGEQEEHAEPVAIVSNHVSWADILIMMSHFFPSFVARDKTATTPLIGVISKLMGCLYVDREKELSVHGAQPGVAALVKQRMQQTAAGELPNARPMLLFPEGTTTNGHYLLPFKTGAFLAGVPVQPVILRYHQGRFSCAWEMIPASRHIFLMLCTPLHSVTCYELPVYVPNAEERADPKLYAANVRKTMMEFATWLQDTCATFQDKKELMAILSEEYGLGQQAKNKGT